MDDDAYIVWQDVFDEVAAGRPQSTRCPFCGAAPMKVQPLSGEGDVDAGAGSGGGVPTGPVRILCEQCGKYAEARFGGF